MTVATRWRWFRNFRRLVLSLASITCLLWSILIAVYLTRNWSNYETGQRGFFAGLACLDFVSSILLYLMIVVRYKYWPDGFRTLVLVGLHTAGAATLLVLKPHLPCNAFGGSTVCNRLTNTVIVGTWAIAGLLTLYALSLPFMVGSHPPSPFNTELEPESASERKVGGNPEETRLVEEEKPASSLVPGSPARLLKNDGPSPEMGPVGLPRFAGLSRSGTASTLSSVAAPFAPPMSRHSQAVSEYANDTVVANAREVGYWTSSHPSQRSSVAQTVRVPSTLRTDTSHTLSWLGPALPGPSLTPPVHLSEDDADEAQVLIEVNHSTNVSRDRSPSPSCYSQPSTAPSRSGTRGRASRQISVRDAQQHTVHRSSSLGIESVASPHPLPLLPALPIPSPTYWTDPGSNRTSYFEPRLANQSRPASTEVGELLNLIGGRPRSARVNSVASNVDMDEWRKLVLGAAGKT